MSAQEPKHDWTTHGMTEREMRSRIKSHRAMTLKHLEMAKKWKVPEAFLTPAFRTWVKNNPNSPWVAGGGMNALQEQAFKSIGHSYKAGKAYNTQKKLSDALQRKQANKLKRDLNKIIGGY